MQLIVQSEVPLSDNTHPQKRIRSPELTPTILTLAIIRYKFHSLHLATGPDSTVGGAFATWER